MLYQECTESSGSCLWRLFRCQLVYYKLLQQPHKQMLSIHNNQPNRRPQQPACILGEFDFQRRGLLSRVREPRSAS